MSVPQPAQPVIPYADATGAAKALTERATDDGGVEFMVAPPALWRQLLGPALLLVVATGGTTFAALGAMIAAFAAPALSALVGLLAVVGLGVWIPTLARLWRIGRHRRLALISVSPTALDVAAPALPPETRFHWSRASMAELLVDGRRPFPWVLELICLRVWSRGGMSAEYYIPWRGGEPLEPVERRVREVLGLGQRTSS